MLFIDRALETTYITAGSDTTAADPRRDDCGAGSIASHGYRRRRLCTDTDR